MIDRCGEKAAAKVMIKAQTKKALSLVEGKSFLIV